MDKLHWPALQPRVIRVRKANAVFDGRMGIEPKHKEWAGIGISEIENSKGLLGSGCCCVRVRDHSVGYLESILVCLVFIMARDDVEER
jgi:hypothetical protein